MQCSKNKSTNQWWMDATICLIHELCYMAHQPFISNSKVSRKSSTWDFLLYLVMIGLSFQPNNPMSIPTTLLHTFLKTYLKYRFVFICFLSILQGRHLWTFKRVYLFQISLSWKLSFEEMLMRNIILKFITHVWGSIDLVWH